MLKYIKDLKATEKIDMIFLISQREIKPKKDGGEYLFLKLSDKTGSLNAQIWDNVIKYVDWPKKGDYCRIKGATRLYKGIIQVTINEITAVGKSEVNPEDYLPEQKFNSDELFLKLREITNFINDPHLKSLVEEFLKDPKLTANLKLVPAASKNHHAYPSGLLVHIISLMNACMQISNVYPELNKDILLTGAFLHDIGKTEELTYDSGFTYTDTGELIGHIAIGMRILEEKIAKITDFPAGLKTQLVHIVLSHHGNLEFGSPVLPKTKEALALHFLDNLDAKLASYKQSMETVSANTNWSGWMSDRKFFKT
ncbi:MAG: HD domain-containing protein [Planctomycetes bacterium]|nr:HD domain-containing protein [Planctomycetota bacterium]